MHIQMVSRYLEANRVCYLSRRCSAGFVRPLLRSYVAGIVPCDVVGTPNHLPKCAFFPAFVSVRHTITAVIRIQRENMCRAEKYKCLFFRHRRKHRIMSLEHGESLTVAIVLVWSMLWLEHSQRRMMPHEERLYLLSLFHCLVR